MGQNDLLPHHEKARCNSSHNPVPLRYNRNSIKMQEENGGSTIALSLDPCWRNLLWSWQQKGAKVWDCTNHKWYDCFNYEILVTRNTIISTAQKKTPSFRYLSIAWKLTNRFRHSLRCTWSSRYWSAGLLRGCSMGFCVHSSGRI